MKRGIIYVFLNLMVTFLLTLIPLNCLLTGDTARPVRNPVVRVVTVCQAGLQRGTNDLMGPTLERLNQAASFRPDIACLPELFSNRAPEPVPGPVTQKLARWAQEHSSYIIFGLKTKKSGGVYNSAVLIDRQGQIAGQYDKAHPTEKEMEEGTVPGEDVGTPVFKTDFGTIGIQICFDVNWRNQWHYLKEKGAQIVFWPSAYPAGHQLPALALSNEYYIVSSTMDRVAQIFDISGDVLASSGTYQEWAGAALPLSKRLFEIDFNAEKARQVQQKYGPKVQVTWFHDSDWFTLTSLDPELTVEDLIVEFGLTPLDDYIARCTKVIDQTRANASGKPQARQ